MGRLSTALLCALAACAVAGCARPAAAASDEGAAPVRPAPAKPDPAPADPEVKTQVLARGEGRELKKDDMALVHLVVSLAQSGKVLMDTHAEGDPQLFVVGTSRFVPAFDQTLPKMRVGDHWRVSAPYQLAWQERGYPRVVPVKSDVVLDLEVMQVIEIATEVLQPGTGGNPVPGEYMLLHYTGTLPDGSVYEDTRKGDAPIVIGLGSGGMIQGMEIALRTLKSGGHVKVTIPWQLTYPREGKKGRVPLRTNVTLDIERLALPDVKIDVVKAGKGPPCQPGQRLTVHYVGTLPDGKTYDSSRDRGTPFVFVLGAQPVIPGWELTLVKMHVGDRWKITVPAVLAYGADGRPGSVPPRSDLSFDIEILAAD